MTSVAPAPLPGALQKNLSTGNIEAIPSHDQESDTNNNNSSLQDSKRLGFAKSFNRLSASNESAQPENINEKLKTTFVDFCSVVEKGVNDALLSRFNQIHGISTPSNDRLASSGSAIHLNVQDTDKQSESATEMPLSQQKKLAQSGSMHSLHHSRAASRGRQESPGGLKHARSLHRAASGRVRSAGKCAACYLSKEESYKLRLTIEARIRCPGAAPEMPPLPPLPTATGKWASTNDELTNSTNTPANATITTTGTSPNISREASKSSLVKDGSNPSLPIPTDPSTTHPRTPSNLTKKTGASRSFTNLQPQDDKSHPPSVAEQARDIRNAITAIINDMPEPIPGTPIIIMFNAIVYHEAVASAAGTGDEPPADYALAFSWKSETNTPCGAMIKELKQQRMELAYREQGVELDSVKAEAAAAAALAEQSTIVGKLKGLLRLGSKNNLKKSSSAVME